MANELTVEGASFDIERMLALAVEKGPDGIEALERLMAMRRELQAEHARARFFQALSAFQDQCPPIQRTRSVHMSERKGGGLMYKFASLEDIEAQTKSLRHRHGLTHRYSIRAGEGGWMNIDCIVTHVDGHSETTTQPIPPTQGQQTNSAQNAGIMSTYGKRYAYLNAFGIQTADEDRDALGLREDGDRITEAQAEALGELITEVGADYERFLDWAKIDDLDELPAAKLEQARRLLSDKARARAAAAE